MRIKGCLVRQQSVVAGVVAELIILLSIRFFKICN